LVVEGVEVVLAQPAIRLVVLAETRLSAPTLRGVVRAEGPEQRVRLVRQEQAGRLLEVLILELQAGSAELALPIPRPSQTTVTVETAEMEHSAGQELD